MNARERHGHEPALSAALVPTRLHVSNLSQAATAAKLRELFGTCGDVLDVAFVRERNLGTVPSAAYVTMSTPSGAAEAIHRLHGRLHHDRSLMITREIAANPAPSAAPAAPPKTTKVAIAQQYREAHAFVYELDCAGARLTLRFFFPTDDDAGDWRVEAQFGVVSPRIANASAHTRRQALDELSQEWAHAAEEPGSAVDWPAVAAALSAVKAL